MKHHKVVRFNFEPVSGYAKEMIEGKIATALSELSRENGRAMKLTSISFLTVEREVFMVVVADLMVSEYEQAIVQAIQQIEKTINPPREAYR